MRRWTLIVLAMAACFVFACGKDKPTPLKLEHSRADWKEYERFPIMKGKLSHEQIEKLGLKEERTKIPYLASVYKGKDNKRESVWKDEILPPGTRVLADKKTGLIKYITKCGNKVFIPVQTPECPPPKPIWRWPHPWNFNLPWWLPLLLLLLLIPLLWPLLRKKDKKDEHDTDKDRAEYIQSKKGSKGATIIPAAVTLKKGEKGEEIETRFHQNPDMVTFHLPKKLTDEVIVNFESPGTSKKWQTPMIRELFAIPGVTKIMVEPYELNIKKGQKFNWNDILPKAQEIVRKYMGESLVKGEFCEFSEEKASTTSTSGEALPEGSYIGILYNRNGIHIANDGLQEVNAMKATKDGNMLIDVVLNKPLKKEGTLELLPGETGIAVTLSEDGSFKISGDGIKPAPEIQLGKGNSSSVFIRAEIARPK